MNPMHVETADPRTAATLLRERVKIRRVAPLDPKMLRARRLALGLTLQDVADAVGITRQGVYRWESSSRPLRSATAHLAFDLLGQIQQ